MILLHWVQGTVRNPKLYPPPLEIWELEFSYDSGSRDEYVRDLNSFVTDFSLCVDVQDMGKDSVERAIRLWASTHFPHWKLERIRRAQ